MFLKSIIIFICSITLLNYSAGQSKHLPERAEQLEEFAKKLISEKPDSAQMILETYSKNYINSKNTHLALICLVYQAEAGMETDHSEEAKQLLTNLLKDSRIDEFVDVKFKIYKLLGDLEFRNGRFFASTQNYRSALELAKGMGDNEHIALINEHLARVFDKINRPDKAVQFYIRSLKLYTGTGNRESIQACALALGRIYLNENKLDSALYYIRQSTTLSQTLKNSSALTESLVEEANVYLKMKQFSIVEAKLKRIDSLMEKEKSTFLKVRQYVLKGNLAMATQGDSIALLWYAKAEEFSHKGFTVFIDSYINSNIAEAYYTNGQYDKAYHYLKDNKKISSAYSSRENNKLAEDISNNSELNIRDREIEFLRLQNQLKQEKLQKEIQIKLGFQRENILKDKTLKQELLLNEANAREQKMQLDQLEKEKIVSQSLLRENNFKQIALLEETKTKNILWLGIGILIGLGGLIFYLFKKQKEKNEIILKQKKDLEFINKEVHHRVKNNLQVISSLLDLQSQSNPDHGVSSLLRESKHRVQSMAFIHQNLYEGEGMNMVDMPSYVKNLTEHLNTTFYNDSKQIKIINHIDPVRLHMDTVVSIGMIINELVTNSLKYAFSGQSQGMVTVELHENHDIIQLSVADNGPGIPEDIDVTTVKSFGYKMIRAFAQKLKAKMTIETEEGTKVQLLIPKK